MRITIHSVLLLTVPLLLHAQERPNQPTLSVIIDGGIGWNGPARWDFPRGGDAPIVPGPSLGLGLQYGPIMQFFGTQVISSFEVGYAEQKAVRSSSSGETVYGVQRFPVLGGLTVIAETRLSPFIKIGAGAAKTDFRELLPQHNITNIRFHEWRFAWSFGSGINYAVDSTLSLGIYTDVWWSEQDITGLDDGGAERGIFGRYALQTYGLRLTFTP